MKINVNFTTAECIFLFILLGELSVYPSFLVYVFLCHYHDPLAKYVSILKQQVSTLQESLQELRLQESYSRKTIFSKDRVVQELFYKEYRIASFPLETHLLVLRGLQEKVDLEVKEVQLQDVNQVHLKEKVLQDVLKEVLIDQQVVRLTMQKVEDQEEANKLKI